jgi:hypothetical protein
MVSSKVVIVPALDPLYSARLVKLVAVPAIGSNCGIYGSMITTALYTPERELDMSMRTVIAPATHAARNLLARFQVVRFATGYALSAVPVCRVAVGAA